MMMSGADLENRIAAILVNKAERVYLIDDAGDRVLTYAGLCAQAQALAIRMRALGAAPGSRVGLLMSNDLDLAVLYFGCLFAGCVAVPVNPSLHRNDISYILGAAAPELVAVMPQTRQLAEEAGCPAERLWPGPFLDGTAPAGYLRRPFLPDAPLTPDTLFTIHFTSGTTARPKGVAHYARSLFACADVFNRCLNIDSEHRFLHVLPMTYMAGMFNTLLGPFLAGGSVVLAPPFDSRSVFTFWEPAMRRGVNAFWLTPSILSALLRVDRNPKAPAYCAQQGRLLCVGTAPLPVAVRKAFEQRYGMTALESYGLSELLFVSTNRHGRALPGCGVGRPLPGVEVRIRPADGEGVSVPGEGEIEVNTPYRLAGYLDADSGQVVAPSNSWFPTGDVGYVSGDGTLVISDRIKDLIIRGGLNISPRAIEEVLQGHPAVDQLAVVGLPHELYGEDIVAVLRLKGDLVMTTALRDELIALCRTEIPAGWIPSRFVTIAEMPVGVSGKIQKRDLRRRLLDGTVPS